MHERNVAKRGQHRFALAGEETVVPRGEHTRGRRYRRDGDCRREVDARQRAAQTAFQSRPAAEQAQAGADFDQQRIGLAEADVAAEAVGPCRETLQQPVFGGRIACTRLQRRAQGTRRRQRLIHTRARLRSLDAGEDDMLALARSIDQRATLPALVHIEHRVQRQVGKMQAGPEHGTFDINDGFTACTSGVSKLAAQIRACWRRRSSPSPAGGRGLG